MTIGTRRCCFGCAISWPMKGTCYVAYGTCLLLLSLPSFWQGLSFCQLSKNYRTTLILLHLPNLKCTCHFIAPLPLDSRLSPFITTNFPNIILKSWAIARDLAWPRSVQFTSTERGVRPGLMLAVVSGLKVGRWNVSSGWSHAPPKYHCAPRA